MYTFLLKSHSGFRYLVLLLVCLAIVRAFIGWFGNKPYTETDRKFNLFALIFSHIQLLLGIVLYFYSPFVKMGDMANTMKDATLRYWTVEHAVMMIFAVVLVTVGHAKAKKAQEAILKHRTIAIFYTLAILMVLAAIVQSGRPILGSGA